MLPTSIAERNTSPMQPYLLRTSASQRICQCLSVLLLIRIRRQQKVATVSDVFYRISSSLARYPKSLCTVAGVGVVLLVVIVFEHFYCAHAYTNVAEILHRSVWTVCAHKSQITLSSFLNEAAIFVFSQFSVAMKAVLHTSFKLNRNKHVDLRLMHGLYIVTYRA